MPQSERAAAAPVIAITAGLRRTGKAEVYLKADYVTAVAKAGGLPLVVPPLADVDRVGAYLGQVDGVLIAGGADINPQRYGQERHERTVLLEPQWEDWTFHLLAEAEARGLPVLAVCLGCQMMNVARGGDLIQDLPSLRPGSLKHNVAAGEPDVLHDVRVEPGTLLASIVGAGPLQVNSSHHQALGRLGAGLRVAAVSPDGVVEAIEDPTRPFFLGIQWHPERISDQPRQAALFEALVDAAKTRHRCA